MTPADDRRDLDAMCLRLELPAGSSIERIRARFELLFEALDDASVCVGWNRDQFLIKDVRFPIEY